MITLRSSRADEATEIAKVHVQADWETYSPIFGTKARRVDLAVSQARWASALNAGDVLLVAIEDDRIIGLGHARNDWMSALYLLASHRRRGIGARLLSELRRRLGGRGVETFGFQVVAANHDAIAFYEAQGARRLGSRMEGAGEDAWEDYIYEIATLRR